MSSCRAAAWYLEGIRMSCGPPLGECDHFHSIFIMGETTFLNDSETLASQVAGFLLKGGEMDLADTEVWIPTAGA